MKNKMRRYSRSALLLSLLMLIVISWYYMAALMSMNMQPIAQWRTLDIIMLFVMPAIMIAGMMLASALPVIMLVNRINESRKTRQSPYTHTLYLVAGYLLVWTLYSVGITAVQYGLYTFAILTPMMRSGQTWFTCLLLATAGIYQWLPIKQRCLQHCRSPLSLITTQWQEGTFNAVKMGFTHGQYCLGCCFTAKSKLSPPQQVLHQARYFSYRCISHHCDYY